MNKKIYIGLGVLGIIIAAITAYYLLRPKNPSESNTVKVGAVLPLTGNVAVFGKWIQQGLELGLENFEGANSDYKGRVKITIEDSKNEAKDGVSAFNKLASTDKIDILISGMSKVSIPLIPLTEEKQLPHFMQEVTYPNVTQKGNLLFRHFIQSDREAKILSDYATNSLKIKSVAIVYVNDEAGVGAEKAFQENFSKIGKVLMSQSFEAQETDFKTIVDKVIKANPEGVFLFGNGPSWANCLKSFHELNYKGVILTNTAMYIPNFRKVAGEESLQGVVFTFPVIDSASDSGKKFIDSYKNKYGEFPSLESAYAYDIITLICETLKSQESKPLFEKLNSVQNFSGAFGETKNVNRDFVTKVAIAKWSGSEYSIIATQ